MKTASFFTYAGAGRISIARMAPRDHPAGYRVFKPLAPHKSLMIGLPIEGFVIGYRGCQLRALDARQVWEGLHALAHPHEPVMRVRRGEDEARGSGCRGRPHRHLVTTPAPDDGGYASTTDRRSPYVPICSSLAGCPTILPWRRGIVTSCST
jgi:hypothetical protein